MTLTQRWLLAIKKCEEFPNQNVFDFEQNDNVLVCEQ